MKNSGSSGNILLISIFKEKGAFEKLTENLLWWVRLAGSYTYIQVTIA
ncbi:hypothetical protein J2T61_001117 [Methanocalculus sp. AMF5]|nr:hypothetical protein [Methanocalculus sp. AMF5]